MNCLDFRRAVFCDPRRVGEEAERHAWQCDACAAFRVHELEIEDRLAEELRVPLPENLAERILSRRAKARRPMRWLALAASLVLAVAIGVYAVTQSRDPLAVAGIDFVMYDEAQSIIDAKPTEWKTLVHAAAGMGVSLPPQLGDMHYVCLYPLIVGAAHHLLVKTPYGKVTLLLIPDRPLAARKTQSAHGLEAVVLPARKGSIVIIGDSARSVQRAEALLWKS